MACYITGIAPTNDVEALENMLGSVAGIDRAKLSVITIADETEEHESSFLNFIHAGGGYLDTDARGSLAGTDTAIITDSGGTGVPGINTPGNQLGYLGTPHVERHLGTLPIPDDEVEDYNDALEDGRSIIAYNCTDAEAADIERAFRDAGVRRVKMYGS